MKKYVLTIREDTCAANNKDVEATDLLAKMRLWGDVADFDTVVEPVRAEYQERVDNLVAQIAAIKEQELTDDELVMLKAYRSCKTKNGEVFQERIDALERQLEETSDEQQRRLARIAEILAQA